ncbi:MAG: SDR family oxidoreductase [Patescibacteria group bacterium]|nr:SDR family oxidoreductase [Patescibacteria group bacterium]
MKKILLIDDNNEISKKLFEMLSLPSSRLEATRLDIKEFLNLNETDKLLKKVVHSKPDKYDCMIIAPMSFSYDHTGDQKTRLDFKVWDELFGINLKIPALLMDHADKIVKKDGSIINLISADYMLGSFVSKIYSASMAAKVSLVKSYANLLGKQKIRVNGVAAGWVREVMNEESYPKALLNEILKFTPIERMASAEEIAKVFCWLASKEASFISGQVIHVDGGYYNVDPVTRLEGDCVKIQGTL